MEASLGEFAVVGTIGNSEWFVARNKQKHGPLSWAQLQAEAASGRLAPGDMVLQKGSAKWVSAKAVVGLFPDKAHAGSTQQATTAQENSVWRQELPTVSEAGSGRTTQTSSTWPSIAGYAILGELGHGGMGVVYKAQHVQLKRLVALKMVLSGAHARAEELARFRKEAEAVARLQHPNIVQIHEVGEHDGRPYFSLEFVEGGTLAKKLAGTPQPPRQAAQFVEILARAIHVAHERGIVHRDLKPGNVLLTQDGQAKIADFGLAKQLDSDQTQTVTGALMGTPSYMAPEQAGGKSRDIGPRTDVYALGTILYEMLTGRPPFQGKNTWETVDQVQNRDPVRPSRYQPKLPRDLETICLKSMEKDPSKRYVSADAMAQDLMRFLKSEPIQARPVGRIEKAMKWSRRHPARALIILLAFLVILLGSGAAATFWRWRQAEDELARRNEFPPEIDVQRNKEVPPEDESVAQERREQKQHAEFMNAKLAAMKKLVNPAVMEALDSTRTGSFKNRPMKEVFQWFEDETKGVLNFRVDEIGIRERNVDPSLLYHEEVTREFNKVKMRTLIREILNACGMAYYIEEGTLVVTFKEKAATKLITRNYPVTNLIGGKQLVRDAFEEQKLGKQERPAGLLAMGPLRGPVEKMLYQNADALISQVTAAVDPEHWQVVNESGATVMNGPGRMVLLDGMGALSVTASPEVHYLLLASGLLDDYKNWQPEPKDDVEFAKAKHLAMKNLVDPKLMEALDSTVVNVRFKETPMKDVLLWLRKEMKRPFIFEDFRLDESGFKEAKIEPSQFFEDKVSKEYKKIKLRTLVREILHERGMGYYVVDNSMTLAISLQAKADTKVITRPYPVANLVGGQQLVQQAIKERKKRAHKPEAGKAPNPQDGFFSNPQDGFFFGGLENVLFESDPAGPNEKILNQNVVALANQLVGSVDPEHWWGNGGPGRMKFLAETASLSVTASVEVHYLLLASGLLDNKKSQ